MSQRAELVSYRGFRYQCAISDVMYFLKRRNPGVMSGHPWAKVRITNEDGSFFYVKRKGVT